MYCLNPARRFWLLILLVAPVFSFAQVNITGKVLNLTTTQPIPYVSVFLSNTTIGNQTDTTGKFSLHNVKPGQYTLVVSIIGFETYQQSVLVKSSNIELPPINILNSPIPLNVVRIKPDNKWFRLYQDFKAEFLGSSDYAKQCKIMDPDSLDLDYDPSTRLLTAKSRGSLVIENKALGYRVKYMLQRFVKDYRNKGVSYKGYTIFEDLKGTPDQKALWDKNRLECYLGSSMHFFRCVIKGDLDTVYNRNKTTGFQVYKVLRSLNQGYHPSENFDDGLSNVDFKFNLTFTDTVLNRTDFFQPTNVDGIYAIVYPYGLYIIYKDRMDYGRAPVYKQFGMINWQTTIAEPTGDYALFDSNGVLFDPTSIVYRGYWATCRVGDLLPDDYEPPQTAQTSSKSKSKK